MDTNGAYTNGIFKSLADLSSGLSNLSSTLSPVDSSDTMKVINASPVSDGQFALRDAMSKALGYKNMDNDLTKQGIPLNENQYLVVNVDCTNRKSVTIPACPIGECATTRLGRILPAG